MAATTSFTSDPAFQASATSTILRVPPAEYWTNDMVLKDKQDQVVAKVLKNEKYGQTGDGQPKWRVTLADGQGTPIAVVRRKMENATDRFVVYSTKPNWPGQESRPHYPDKGSKASQFDIYELAEIKQSAFGGTYWVRSCKDNRILLKASNQEIVWTLLCCMLAFCCGCFKWNLRFYDMGGREPAIVRNQKTEEIEIAAGSSPLLGICIAYAVDRQLRLC